MTRPLPKRRSLEIPANISPEERLELLLRARDMTVLAEEAEAQAAREAGYAYRRRGEAYWSDPVAWAEDCIAWPEGGLAPYQQEALAMLVQHGRVAVRAVHSAGKSVVAAIATLWFSITREAAGADWKIITTASVKDQLFDYLWPEIRKWEQYVRWDKVGREPFDHRTEMLTHDIKLRHGTAIAISPDEPTAMEGAHADQLLYIFDEAKAIADPFWDAAEGAFSSANNDRIGTYALAISTPGEPIGRFYAIHSRRPGTETWWPRHVSLDEAVAAGRTTREWANACARLWGEDSAIYRNRVLGEFASAGEDGIIPLSWVEAANARWRAKYEVGGVVTGSYREVQDGTRQTLAPGEKVHVVGVDVARGGEDRSVLALRQGNTIVELRRMPFSDDTMRLANAVAAVQGAHGNPRAVVDAIGVGAGCYDRIREQDLPCSPFIGSARSRRHDQTGEFGFANKRAWSYWNLREMLDPENGLDVALPPDDRLTGDLVSIRYREVSGARIQVESKEEIKKRLGRSPDDGDAVVMAFSESGGSWAELYVVPDEDEEDDGVEKPRQKPSRAGGWGTVYAPPPEQEAAGEVRTLQRAANGLPMKSGWFTPS